MSRENDWAKNGFGLVRSMMESGMPLELVAGTLNVAALVANSLNFDKKVPPSDEEREEFFKSVEFSYQRAKTLMREFRSRILK